MKRTQVIVLILAVVLLAAVTVAIEARPATPTVAPAYLEWGMPHGATARLECDGWLDVVEDGTSVIEVVCQPWVMRPED